MITRTLIRVLLLTAATLAIWLFLVRHSGRTGGEISSCRVSYVYDGDTVAVTCGTDEVTARLVGLDTAETKTPGCDAELAHGRRATLRLRQLVAGGEVEMKRKGDDRYGRVLVVLTVDGVDVADTLVLEGLAVPYSGGKRINWCERLVAG